MTELFPNVRDKVRETAQVAWSLACAQKEPSDAAEFLDNVLRYYDNLYTQEEIEFLQFYFRMKMETVKDE